MGKKMMHFAAVLEDETSGFKKRQKAFLEAKDEHFGIRRKSEKRRLKSGRTKKK